MILPFCDELKEPIQNGTKLHTFRAYSSKNWRVGMQIHFYALYRKPGMHQFYPARPVVSLQAAEMTTEGMFIEGRQLVGEELALFARRDGFATVEEFFAFFKARPLPIIGQVIHWTPLRYGPPAPAQNQ